MAQGRIYTLPFSRVTITLVQDLWNVAATANMAFELHSINLGAETATTAEELAIQIKRLTATVTNGTGGASVTPVPVETTSSAATVTCRCNDATTRATTNGTTTVMFSDTWQLTNGYVYQWVPEDRLQFNMSQNLLIGLEVAPAASHVCSGVITVAEII